MLYHATFATPVGPFTAAVNQDGALVATAFGDLEALTRAARVPLDDLTHDPARLDHVRDQLDAYFAGARHDFDLALAPQGTPFQQRVWQTLRDIPLGETRSYGRLAAELGSSPRAVGGANGANRICLVIPCHRVIGADGSLTGFAYGTEIKRRLLEHEATFARREADLTVPAR